MADKHLGITVIISALVIFTFFGFMIHNTRTIVRERIAQEEYTQTYQLYLDECSSQNVVPEPPEIEIFLSQD